MRDRSGRGAAGRGPRARRRTAGSSGRSNRPAGLLAFLYTENQLFEGEELHHGWTRLDDRISDLFRRGQLSGEFRIDLTPAWLTEALFGLLASGAWMVQSGKGAPKDFQHMIAELLLGGALRPGQAPHSPAPHSPAPQNPAAQNPAAQNPAPQSSATQIEES